MNTRNYSRILLLLLLPAVLCTAAGARAQYIKKESLPDKNGTKQDFAVFYADGMPETAQWPLGTINTDQQGRTLRHQVNHGNGNNRNVNNKISARFIISPCDVPIRGRRGWGNATNPVTYGHWAYAAGELPANAGGSQAIFLTTDIMSGCHWFNSASANPDGKYTNRRWRMPTQRELMIMMVLQDGINAIYGLDPSPTETDEKTNQNTRKGMNGKVYWSATEEDDEGNPTNSSRAWVVDFTADYPKVYPAIKNPTNPQDSQYFRLRCVSDY